MLRILDRYIYREIIHTWLAVTIVLLFILLINQFARVLGEVAKGYLPRGAAFQVIGLTGVQYLTILIPIGVFLSIMLALGRLYRDSEMPAMLACRVGPGGVYRPVFLVMVPLAILVGWLSMVIGPLALTEIREIGVEARRQADLASIEPGKFTSGSGGAVVYAEKVLGPGILENVFLQRRRESGEIEVVIAERGEQRESDDPDTRYFVLYNGRRYEGIPGSTEFRVMQFAEHGIPYQLPGASKAELAPREMPTLQLIGSSEQGEVAEFHFRLAVPIATIILALLAVPLSQSQPRQGRYGKLAIGLLIFIIYFNLISAGKTWLENGTVQSSVGLWWVHGTMGVFAAALIAVQNGLHRRLLTVRTIS